MARVLPVGVGIGRVQVAQPENRRSVARFQNPSKSQGRGGVHIAGKVRAQSILNLKTNSKIYEQRLVIPSAHGQAADSFAVVRILYFCIARVVIEFRVALIHNVPAYGTVLKPSIWLGKPIKASNGVADLVGAKEFERPPNPPARFMVGQ